MAAKPTPKTYLTDGSVNRRTVSVQVFIKGRKRASCYDCGRPAQYFVRRKATKVFACGLHVLIAVRRIARYQANWNRKRGRSSGG